MFLVLFIFKVIKFNHRITVFNPFCECAKTSVHDSLEKTKAMFNLPMLIFYHMAGRGYIDHLCR